MYSSLDKIDIVAGPKGGRGPIVYAQTDHRSNQEIEETPEVSALFALARVINAQTHAETEGKPADVVYATQQEGLPVCVQAVLAATGAKHQAGNHGSPRALPTTETTAGELADEAFRALAARVSRRVGLTDMATVLRALEAETVADPPSQVDDEPGYWTRVLELAAVTCEIVRGRSGGHWEISHHADVPFGFATTPGPSGSGGIILPTNRAHRLIADGKDESMFLLLAADREVSAAAMHPESLPVMPNLRSRREALECKLAWRPLYAGAPDDDGFPVIVYGHDTPETFGAFLAERAGDLDAAHVKAMANLAEQEVTTQDVEIDGVDLVAVSGSYYAAEKLLDREFMRGLHRRLGHDLLVASVPRRGLMFVAAVERSDKREVLVLQLATREESQTTRSISEALVLVRDGAVDGHVQIERAPSADDEDGDEDDSRDVDEPESPPRKRSWWSRLFGRKK